MCMKYGVLSKVTSLASVRATLPDFAGAARALRADLTYGVTVSVSCVVWVMPVVAPVATISMA